MRKNFFTIFLAITLLFGLTSCSSASSGSEKELFEPGTYRVTVDGRNGPVVVDVALSKNKVTKIEVLEHSDSEGFADAAMQSAADDIIARQSFEVDAVSGATISVYAILRAVSVAANAAGADFEIISRP